MLIVVWYSLSKCAQTKNRSYGASYCSIVRLTKKQTVNNMSDRALAQRFVELEWPNLYHPLRTKLVEETVSNLQSGYITRAEVETMVREMEELNND